MNQFAFKKPPKSHDPACGDFITMAERELAAFFTAVTELFGLEQAEISTEDWLHELMSIDNLPDSTRQWQLLTIRASARLASRVNASSVSSPARTLAYSD
ncbi:MAG TPA: hypothetical protein VGM18_04320 [Candidatus Sulfotelmatobacter sp.]|jgi:hypothetical protein